MTNPYRPEGSAPNEELARLARQGQQRIAVAAEGQHLQAQHEANYHLRVAIGSVRGSPLRRSFLFAIALGLLLVAAGIMAGNDTLFDPVVLNVAPIGFFLAFGSFFAYVFVAPRATRGQVQAERAYVASLPFPLEGYFEALSGEPQGFCKLRIELEWRASGTDPATLQGVFGLIDTAARVTTCDAGAASVTTGPISGITNIRVNRVPVYRNHGLAKYLRRLIEQVLLPLDRNAGIARVRVVRAY